MANPEGGSPKPDGPTKSQLRKMLISALKERNGFAQEYVKLKREYERLERDYSAMADRRVWWLLGGIKRLGEYLKHPGKARRQRPARPVFKPLPDEVLVVEPIAIKERRKQLGGVTLRARIKGAAEREAANASGAWKSAALEGQLWRGFSDSASQALIELASDESQELEARRGAALSLARWHASGGRFEAALERLDAIPAETGENSRGLLGRVMLEANVLCRLKRGEEARTVLSKGHAFEDWTASELLMLANTFNVLSSEAPDEKKVIEYINRVYGNFQLAPIAKRHYDQALGIDNIHAVVPPVPEADAVAKVSVIVPVFNAGTYVLTALRSLAEQSYRNIEVVVVDDCSTDDTAAVAEGFCRADSRFRVKRMGANGGSYVARNAVLPELMGELLTVHDGDDWSHPQKLEWQVRMLAASSEPFNYTSWARATDELFFGGSQRGAYTLLSPDHASAMFRTDIVRGAGGWDNVRISADTELMWRIEAIDGRSRHAARARRILPYCPFAFGRIRIDSLTRSGPTSILTIDHGVRREYRESAEAWHSRLKQGSAIGMPPFFPAPNLIRPQIDPAGNDVDALLINDWRDGEIILYKIMDEIKRRVGSVPRFGLFHYPYYDSDIAEPLSKRFRNFAFERDLKLFSAGEAITCRAVAVLEERLFQHKIDLFPTVAADRGVLLVADPPLSNLRSEENAGPEAKGGDLESKMLDLLPDLRIERTQDLVASILKVVGEKVPAEPA